MLNQIMLIGNVGRNPDYHEWEAGGSVAVTTLATTERSFTTRDGRDIPERTEWHNLVFKNSLGDTVHKYVHRGDRIFVSGRMTYRNYDDNEGVKRTVAEVIVNKLVLLGGKQPEKAAEPKDTSTEDELFR